MRKMKLDVNDLRVESFDTRPDPQPGRGTVRGNGAYNGGMGSWDGPCPSFLCPDSHDCSGDAFCPTPNVGTKFTALECTCAGTCGDTCPNTCGNTCATCPYTCVPDPDIQCI